MRCWLDLLDRKTKKRFKKYFQTEFERDKFERKLKCSKKLIVLDKSSEGFVD